MGALAYKRAEQRAKVKPPPEGYRRTDEVSAITGVSVRTLQRWVQEERVRFQRPSARKTYICVKDAEILAATMRTGPKK